MLTAASLAQRPVGQRAQRQQLLAGRVSRPASIAVHLRRKNRMRKNSHGIATARIGGAATASGQHATPASSRCVLRLWPAPAMSSAASLAAVSGLLNASPISGTSSALSPAESRLLGDPVGPAFDLPADLGDRRHRGVHRHTDEHPDERPAITTTRR